MDILFITPYLPSENSGHAGTQLIFRKLKQISKIHEIKVVSFFNSEDKNHFTEIEKLGIDVKILKLALILSKAADMKASLILLRILEN